jgi:nucleoside triphosphate pyrophosphatase
MTLLNSWHLILASSSPRRSELLREIGIPFTVDPAHINEDQRPGEPPLDYVLRLAEEKARAVAERHKESHVLGADTTVVVDGEILAKPLDAADAVRMLRMLSGRGHEVITAVSLVSPGGNSRKRQANTRSCTTRVFFRKIQEEEIQSYVAGGEPMDKAGAYAIQGGAALWAERMEGEYSNVVGLPLPLIAEMLKAQGLLF